MRPDVEEMEDAVDRMWSRLAIGYTVFAAGTFAILLLGMPLWSLAPWGAATLGPWFIASIKVQRAISRVRRNTAKIKTRRV